jgi:uncharacterized protein YecA (UPF0149 family)
MIQNVELARHRLEILYADESENNQRRENILDLSEQAALRIVLDELHRLNMAVSEQRKTLQSIADRKKKTHRKHAAARTGRPTTRSTSGKQ